MPIPIHPQCFSAQRLSRNGPVQVLASCREIAKAAGSEAPLTQTCGMDGRAVFAGVSVSETFQVVLTQRCLKPPGLHESVEHINFSEGGSGSIYPRHSMYGISTWFEGSMTHMSAWVWGLLLSASV